MTMGDRVAVLKPVADESERNLQQIDTPQMLLRQPCQTSSSPGSSAAPQ